MYALMSHFTKSCACLHDGSNDGPGVETYSSQWQALVLHSVPILLLFVCIIVIRDMYVRVTKGSHASTFSAGPGAWTAIGTRLRFSVPRSASDERLGCGPGNKAKDMELWTVLTSPLVLAVAVGITLVIAYLYYRYLLMCSKRDTKLNGSICSAHTPLAMYTLHFSF